MGSTVGAKEREEGAAAGGSDVAAIDECASGDLESCRI